MEFRSRGRNRRVFSRVGVTASRSMRDVAALPSQARAVQRALRRLAESEMRSDSRTPTQHPALGFAPPLTRRTVRGGGDIPGFAAEEADRVDARWAPPRRTFRAVFNANGPLGVQLRCRYDAAHQCIVVEIYRVGRGTLAERSGLRTGDWLVDIDSTPIWVWSSAPGERYHTPIDGSGVSADGVPLIDEYELTGVLERIRAIEHADDMNENEYELGGILERIRAIERADDVEGPINEYELAGIHERIRAIERADDAQGPAVGRAYKHVWSASSDSGSGGESFNAGGARVDEIDVGGTALPRNSGMGDSSSSSDDAIENDKIDSSRYVYFMYRYILYESC